MSTGRIHYQITKLRLVRLAIQLLFLLLLNAAAFGIADVFLPIPLPINFPLGPFSILEGAFYTAQRMLAYAVIPFITFASFLLIGGLVGRLFCGWVCPFGTIQDLLGLVKREKYIVSRDIDRPTYETIPLIYLILVMLQACLIGAAQIFGGAEAHQTYMTQLGVFAEVPAAVVDPSATLFGAIPYWLLFGTFPPESIDALFRLDFFLWLRLFILVFSVITPLFVSRFWCRFVCPVGFITGTLGKNSVVGIDRIMTKCTNCRQCDDSCPMGVRITELPAGRIRHQNCILCMDCVNACPENALKITAKVK